MEGKPSTIVGQTVTLETLARDIREFRENNPSVDVVFSINVKDEVASPQIKR